MDPKTQKSKLDRLSMALLVFGFILFLEAAICYAIAATHLLMEHEPIVLTLGQIGNIAGISGMIIIPFFILSAAITNYRLTKTGNDLDDDHPERGTAGSS